MKVLILSGAGLSAPSGLPTFRGKGGIWNDDTIERVCYEGSWRLNFEEMHAFYNTHRRDMNQYMPNHAHDVIARLMNRHMTNEIVNITQNVDDLFERAGCNAVHLHGEITKMECVDCGAIWNAFGSPWIPNVDKCVSCGETESVKPHVVFFGGHAPRYVDFTNALDQVTDYTTTIVIGASSHVIDVDTIVPGLPGKKIRCNAEAGEMDSLYDEVLIGDIAETIDNAIAMI